MSAARREPVFEYVELPFLGRCLLIKQPICGITTMGFCVVWPSLTSLQLYCELLVS
jgi:hypothetical protein